MQQATANKNIYKILVGKLERNKSLCIFQWQNNIKPYLKKIFLSLVLSEVCFSGNDFAQNATKGLTCIICKPHKNTYKNIHYIDQPVNTVYVHNRCLLYHTKYKYCHEFMAA